MPPVQGIQIGVRVMAKCGTLTLIHDEQIQDAIGVFQTVRTSREVFCEVSSVTRQEFFDGGRAGLNPSFQFSVFAGDYAGESICVYEGKSYAIYRTYMTDDSDYLELYAQREGGTNGKDNSGYLC